MNSIEDISKRIGIAEYIDRNKVNTFTISLNLWDGHHLMMTLLNKKVSKYHRDRHYFCGIRTRGDNEKRILFCRRVNDGKLTTKGICLADAMEVIPASYEEGIEVGENGILNFK